MVERAPNYRATFKSLPRLGVLDNVAPFVNTDVTNPRELYAMLSESQPQGKPLTYSGKFGSQAGAKLPPLGFSSEHLGLGKHTQHSSYPDLSSYRSDRGAPHSDRHTVRRSSSLQDLHSPHQAHTANQGKKLKPILRDNNNNNGKNGNAQQERPPGVKFGQKEVHLIGDSPLPPIEGMDAEIRGKGGLSFSVATEEGQGEKPSSTPRSHGRGGAELSRDMFPRGQPVEVKKPATPTYNDYPEIYWELRSATVQDPSDLKEDMIDRDRYRLQQISSLRLRAMNRELAANKLDSYRKWQLQMLASSPSAGMASKQDSARSSVTPSMAGPSTSAKAGRQLRMSVPIQNGVLAVAATSISPNTNPVTKKRQETTKTSAPKRPANGDGYITEDELRRRQRIEAAARGETGSHESDGKHIKVTVVNLSIDQDRSSESPTSDVYNGIRRIMFGPRPLSNRTRTQVSFHSKAQQDQASVTRPSETASVASINATLGSAQSHRFPRVFSAPANSVADGSLAVGADMTDTDSSVASKKILKKFNTLQVFSEKCPARDSKDSAESYWDMVNARPTEKGQYLAQSRPPTYKLDLKRYPGHHSPVKSRGGAGEDMGVIVEGGDSNLLLPNQQDAIRHLGNPSPARSDGPSVSFRFGNGEVIVSRQGKKPNAT